MARKPAKELTAEEVLKQQREMCIRDSRVLWTRYSGNINRILKKYLLLWGCQVKRRVKLQL